MKLEEHLIEVPHAPGDAPVFEIELPEGAAFRAAFQHVKRNEISGEVKATTRMVFALDPDRPKKLLRLGMLLPGDAIPPPLVPHVTFLGTFLAGHPTQPVPISIYSWDAATDTKIATELAELAKQAEQDGTEPPRGLRSIPDVQTTSIAELDLSDTASEVTP